MMAAYRLRGLGWFAGCAAMVLGFYLVSLQVAHERNALDALNRRIVGAERDIRALETEFDTRANLQQLERWNGDILALSAPTASQFVRDGGQLAAVRFDAAPAPSGKGEVRVAALVVPSLPVAPVAQPAMAQPAVVQAAAVAMPAAKTAAKVAPAPIKVAFARAAPAPVKVAAARAAVKPQPKAAAKVAVASAPRVARPIDLLAEVRTRPTPRQAPARTQRVAMLDGALLSDLGARARSEASRR